MSNSKKTGDNNPASSTSVASKRKESSSNVTKLPSIHVTNFNTQKSSERASAQAAAAASAFNVSSVIVSKKRKERPRRQSPDKSAKLDYRRSFGNPDKFTRSISVPGPGPGKLTVFTENICLVKKLPSIMLFIIDETYLKFMHKVAEQTILSENSWGVLRLSKFRKFSERFCSTQG